MENSKKVKTTEKSGRYALYLMKKGMDKFLGPRYPNNITNL